MLCFTYHSSKWYSCCETTWYYIRSLCSTYQLFISNDNVCYGICTENKKWTSFCSGNFIYLVHWLLFINFSKTDSVSWYRYVITSWDMFLYFDKFLEYLAYFRKQICTQRETNAALFIQYLFISIVLFTYSMYVK